MVNLRAMYSASSLASDPVAGAWNEDSRRFRRWLSTFHMAVAHNDLIWHRVQVRSIDRSSNARVSSRVPCEHGGASVERPSRWN